MRKGRGANPGHDQKSVEQPPKQRTKMKQFTSAEYSSKVCGKCGCDIASYSRTKHGALSRAQVLLLDKRELFGFDKDAKQSSGLQSWCKQCKDEWEYRPENIFSRTRSFLVSDEPDQWHAWERTAGGAFAEFMRKWDRCRGVCHYCDAGLREWQVGGHILDRIDNDDRRHSPANTTLCCWPCNHSKGNKSPLAYKIEIKPYLDEYGPGNVPHGVRDRKYKRSEIRITRHLVIVDSCQQLDLCGPAGI